LELCFSFERVKLEVIKPEIKIKSFWKKSTIQSFVQNHAWKSYLMNIPHLTASMKNLDILSLTGSSCGQIMLFEYGNNIKHVLEP